MPLFDNRAYKGTRFHVVVVYKVTSITNVKALRFTFKPHRCLSYGEPKFSGGFRFLIENAYVYMPETKPQLWFSSINPQTCSNSEKLTTLNGPGIS